MTTPVTLQSLLPPITGDDVKALLLQTLQGIGPVQQVGQGAGVVQAVGSPVASYDAVITIGTAGAPGTSTFTYSLDAGVTVNGPFTVPSSGNYPVSGSGLTLLFSGTFVSGNRYFFGTIYPVFQLTDFESGSGIRTFIETESLVEADLAGSAIPKVTAGGFVDYSSGDWLTFLSSEFYNFERLEPGVMVGVISLSMAATAGSQTFAAGALVVANSLGTGSNVYQYSNVSGFTINPGDTLQVAVQGAAPGSAYNVANGVVTSIITARPGLTCTNPSPGTSAVTTNLGATGVVTVTGSPNGNFSVVLRVLSTGALGTATAQFSLDGGSNFSAPFTLPGSGTYALPTIDGLGSTGLTLHLSGTFTTPDNYTFTSYGSWVVTPGVDEESDVSLQSRDKARWQSLGVTQGNPELVWEMLAKSTPNGGSEVSRVRAVPDLVVGGQLNITVTGPTGPVSFNALANITGFLYQRAPLGTSLVVQNALVQTLAVVGTVYVLAAQVSAAQTAIAAAFARLAAATPIQGIVTYASIVNAIESQGASGVTNVHVTSPAPNVDTQLNPVSTVSFDLSGLEYVLQ